MVFDSGNSQFCFEIIFITGYHKNTPPSKFSVETKTNQCQNNVLKTE